MHVGPRYGALHTGQAGHLAGSELAHHRCVQLQRSNSTRKEQRDAEFGQEESAMRMVIEMTTTVACRGRRRPPPCPPGSCSPK